MSYAITHRPQTLEQVIGQAAIVKSLRKLEGDALPHTFLLHGLSGTGKTTIARIIATMAGADPASVDEVNAADVTGIDDWRKKLAGLQHMPQVGPVKVVIVDECQALSAASWKVLLKPTEDVPAHVYWVFCTTDFGKVPETLVTRAIDYQVRPCSADDLYGLIARVAEHEGLWPELGPDAHGSRADLFWEVVAYAQGSPRQALTGLEAIAGVSDLEEAKALLAQPKPPKEVIALVRAVVAGKATYRQAIQLVQCLGRGTDPESVRRSLIGYTVKVVCSDKTVAARIPRLLTILEHFGTPYTDRRTIAPLLLSIGRVMT